MSHTLSSQGMTNHFRREVCDYPLKLGVGRLREYSCQIHRGRPRIYRWRVYSNPECSHSRGHHYALQLVCSGAWCAMIVHRDLNMLKIISQTKALEPEYMFFWKLLSAICSYKDVRYILPPLQRATCETILGVCFCLLLFTLIGVYAPIRIARFRLFQREQAVLRFHDVQCCFCVYERAQLPPCRHSPYASSLPLILRALLLDHQVPDTPVYRRSLCEVYQLGLPVPQESDSYEGDSRRSSGKSSILSVAQFLDDVLFLLDGGGQWQAHSGHKYEGLLLPFQDLLFLLNSASSIHPILWIGPTRLPSAVIQSLSGRVRPLDWILPVPLLYRLFYTECILVFQGLLAILWRLYELRFSSMISDPLLQVQASEWEENRDLFCCQRGRLPGGGERLFSVPPLPILHRTAWSVVGPSLLPLDLPPGWVRCASVDLYG